MEMIEALRVENAELRERVRQFEEVLREPIPALWGLALTPARMRLLTALYRSPGVAPFERLRVATYRLNSDAGPKCVDVHICVLRKQCRPLGIVIENVRGVGYRLTAESRVILRQLIERQAQMQGAANPLPGRAA